MRRLFDLLLLVLLIGGCGERPAREPAANRPSTEIPVSGGTLVRRLSSDVTTLNFVRSSTSHEKYVLSLLHDALLEWDQNLELGPGIAKKWEVSKDGRVYTLELDPRATFSDGQKVRATDVVFTLRKIVDPASESVQLAGLFDGLDLQRTRAVSEETVEVAFTTARAGQLTSFNIPVLPEHVYRDLDNENEDNWSVVGTGPYRLARYEPGTEILLERRPDYWRENPYIDSVLFRIISDDSVAWNAMKRGEIDEMQIKSDRWMAEKDSPQVKSAMEIHRFYELAYNFIAWNNRDPILSDRDVRRALTMALDRGSIVESLYHGTARVITGPFTPDQWAYNPNVQPVVYDLEGARKLLLQAGWRDSDRDGILDRDGKPLEIEALMAAGSATSADQGQIFQDSLRRIGVILRLTPLEGATFFERILDGNFQGAFLAWGIDPDPDLFSVFHSSQIPPIGQNFVYYSNPRVDQLIEQGRRELDHGRRREIHHELHRILNQDQPYTWIVQVSQKWGVNRRVRNVEVGKGLGLFFWRPDSLQWWLAGSSN
ncbi:MAG TPA: ABC transporter substrate-binding protein [Thermoanaerobaculia bacterium]|nr:ABC transporter substrate-binding protein [Thermoanaerobaculia bacterium]